MPKICATIAITGGEKLKWHMHVNTKINLITQEDYAKIAIWLNIT